MINFHDRAAVLGTPMLTIVRPVARPESLPLLCSRKYTLFQKHPESTPVMRMMLVDEVLRFTTLMSMMAALFWQA